MAHSIHVDSSTSFEAEYHFGRPHVYLTPQEIARVLIARSRLGDTRADHAAENVDPPRGAQAPRTPGVKFTPDGNKPCPRRAMPLHIRALVPSMNPRAASIGTPIAPPTTEGLNQ